MKKRDLLHSFRVRRVLAPTMLSAVLVALFSIASMLQAQFLVRPVDLSYLARRADIIVQGRVTNVVHESLSGYPNIPTVKVTLNVENMLRGPEGGTYTFREIFVGLRARTGNQSYKTGRQLMLFLPSPSRYGLSSPVGIEQGRFHITRDSRGIPVVVNESGNIGLFRNVAETANMAGHPLTESQLRIASSENAPVPLNEFVSIVKNLMLMPRIR